MNIAKIQVKANVRYWEDSRVNGAEDTEGNQVPCRQGDYWMPIIRVDTGVIENWVAGTTAEIRYKVVDGCGWSLIDTDGNTVRSQDDGYVPDTLCPHDNGYGDYMDMNIDADGKIEKWKFDIDDFNNDED